MGLINDIRESGKTIYEVDIATLKKMVAHDLDINEEAITISAKNRSEGHQRESYTVFVGLTIIVDHSKVTKKSSLQYPPGVRDIGGGVRGSYVDSGLWVVGN